MLKDIANHIVWYAIGGIISFYFFFLRRKIVKAEERETLQDNRLYDLEKEQAILKAKLVDKDDFFKFADNLRDSLSEKIEGYKKDHESRLEEFLSIQDKKFQNLDFKLDSLKNDINRKED